MAHATNRKNSVLLAIERYAEVISKAQLWLRSNREKYTRPARYSMELAFQRDLHELDPELELRYNMKGQFWAVYYDNSGIISILRTVDAAKGWLCGTFREIYQWLKHDGATAKKELIRQHIKERETEAELDRKKRHAVAEEIALETHKCARGRVVTDGVKTKWHLA